MSCELMKAKNNREARSRETTNFAAARKSASPEGEGGLLAPRRWPEIFRRFREAAPEPKSELDYVNPYTLLVAVVLSAQATDVGVNKATRALFRQADTPAEDGGARRGAAAATRSRPSACSATRPRTSSRCRRTLVERAWRRGAARPRGAGDAARRRAQDRQCRAERRLRRSRPSRSTRISSASPTAPGWRRARRRCAVETGLERIVPADFLLHAHHWLILHGRYVCKARKPECPRCLIADLCRYEPKTTPEELKTARTHDGAAALRRRRPRQRDRRHHRPLRRRLHRRARAWKRARCG